MLCRSRRQFALSTVLLIFARVCCFSLPAVFLSQSTLSELKRIVVESDILKEDDSQWPNPDADGRQELEIVVGSEHISFVTTKIGSLVDVEGNADAE
jgi:protein mago nashi